MFTFHLIKLPRYRETVEQLERIEAGEKRLAPKLRRACWKVYDTEEFSLRNFGSDWLFDRWDAVLKDKSDPPTRIGARKLGEVAVALLSMPGFQMFPRPDREDSPAYGVFGEWEYDCGLFEEVCRESPWFSTFLADGFAKRPEPYPVGSAMFLATKTELKRVAERIAAVPSAPPDNPWRDTYRDRMVETLLVVSRGKDVTLAFCEQ